MQNVTFKNIFGDTSCYDEVIKFWQELKALPAGIDPYKRASQLLFIARKDDRIIGVTTTHRIEVPGLNNLSFYNFRVLVHPEFRMPGLVDKLCVLSRDYLQEKYINKETDCVGMMTLVENKALQEHRNEAVWPSSGFTYIGKSQKGSHIRILYFKGAKV